MARLCMRVDRDLDAIRVALFDDMRQHCGVDLPDQRVTTAFVCDRGATMPQKNSTHNSAVCKEKNESPFILSAGEDGTTRASDRECAIACVTIDFGRQAC